MPHRRSEWLRLQLNQLPVPFPYQFWQHNRNHTSTLPNSHTRLTCTSQDSHSQSISPFLSTAQMSTKTWLPCLTSSVDARTYITSAVQTMPLSHFRERIRRCMGVCDDILLNERNAQHILQTRSSIHTTVGAAWWNSQCQT